MAASQVIALLKESDFIVTEAARSTQLDSFDRFSVLIPYCKINIKVRVIMNAGFPEMPPDFMLISQSQQAMLAYSELVSLWDPADPSSVLKILERIKKAYGEYQKELFNEHKSEAVEELVTIANSLNSSESPLEMLVVNELNTPLSITLAIPLPLTTPSDSRSPIICNVTVKPTMKLYALDMLYPDWAASLRRFSVQNILRANVYQWPYEKFYKMISQLIQFLQGEVEELINQLEGRKRLCHQLCEIALGVPVEVDSQDHSFIAFFVEIPENIGRFFQIHIKLSEQHPRISPNYLILSQDHVNTSKQVKNVRGWYPSLSIKDQAYLIKARVTEDLKDLVRSLK